MSTFFWSDTHFGHRNIIKYAERPYASVEEMNDALIKRWNFTVNPEDTIWFLGDFGWSGPSNYIKDIFRKLNGTKCLVVGNHDDRIKEIQKLPWNRIERLFTYKEGDARAELCHYPLMSWKSSAYGTLMLHGHSHGSLPKTHPNRIDVGCDVFHCPVSFGVLLEIAKRNKEELTERELNAN
jgi:calcineurin-like phosphoesterase family protein